MHESPKLEIGNFSVPYHQLIAWCDPGHSYELVYRDDNGSIKTTDTRHVSLSTETRETISKHLDENVNQTDATIPKELEPLINSLPNKQQIPRCNQHYLHLQEGSFPLRFIKDWSIDKNCSGEWLQLDFTPEIFIRTRFYIRSEKVPTEIIDQLKTAWFIKLCLQFSSTSNTLQQKMKSLNLSNINHSIALTIADRFYKHMIKSSKGTEYIKGIQLLCELVNHLSNSSDIKEPSTNEFWDKITEATFDKVERDLNESIKNLKSLLPIQQKNPQSVTRYSFYSYYLQKVENHKTVFNGKNKNELCHEYIKLILFVDKLVSFQTYPEITQWCLNDIQQLIVELVLNFSHFMTNEENLESLLLELELDIQLCNNDIRASSMREHKTGIVHHLQQRVKKYPKMYDTDEQIKKLCTLTKRCCYLITSQNLTTDEWEFDISSLIKEYKLNKTPADVLQESLEKLKVLSSGEEHKALVDYCQRIDAYSKKITSEDEIYQLYQFVTECFNPDINKDRLESKLKELNLCLPLPSPTPREKFDTLLQTLKAEIEDTQKFTYFRCQNYRRYHYRISHYSTTNDEEINKLCLLIEKCIKIMNKTNQFTVLCCNQIDQYIKELHIEFPIDEYNESLLMLDFRLGTETNEVDKKHFNHYKEQLIQHKHPQLTKFIYNCFIDGDHSWYSSQTSEKLDKEIKKLNLLLGKEKLNSLLETLKTELEDTEAKIIYRCQVFHQYHYRIISHPTTNAEEINKLCLLTEKCIKMINDQHTTLWCCEQIDNYIKELKLELIIDEYKESLAMLDFRIKNERASKDRVYFEYYKQKLISYQHPDILKFIYHCLHDCYFLWYQECARYVLDNKINELNPQHKLQTLLKKFEEEFEAHSTVFRHQVLRKYHYRIIKHSADTAEEITKLCSLIERCMELLCDTTKMTHWCCEQIDNYIKELKLNFVIDQYNELHHLLDFRIKHESNFVTPSFQHYKQQITQHQQPQVLSFVLECLETLTFNWGPQAIKLLDDKINEIELKTHQEKLNNLLKKFQEEFEEYPTLFRCQVFRKYYYRITKHPADTAEEIKKLCSLIEKCLELFYMVKYPDTIVCCSMIDNYIKELNLNFVVDQYNELHHLLDFRMKGKLNFVIETLEHYKKQITKHQQPEVLSFVLECLETLPFDWSNSAIKLLDDKINEIELKTHQEKLNNLLKKFQEEFDASPTVFRRQVFRKYHYRIINHPADTAEEIIKLCSLIEKCLEWFDTFYYPQDTIACCSIIDNYIKELKLNFVIDQYNELHHLLDFRIKHESKFDTPALQHYKQQITKHQQPEVLAFVQECLETFAFVWSTPHIKLLDDKINQIELGNTQKQFDELIKKFKTELKSRASYYRYQSMRKHYYRIVNHKTTSVDEIQKLCSIVQKALELLECNDHMTDWCLKQMDSYVNDIKINFTLDPYNEILHVMKHVIKGEYDDGCKKTAEYYRDQIIKHPYPELFAHVQSCVESFTFSWRDMWARKKIDDKIKEIEQLSPQHRLQSLLKQLDDDILNTKKVSSEFRAQVMSKYQFRIKKYKPLSSEEINKLCKITEKCIELLPISTHMSGWCCEQMDNLIKELNIEFPIDLCNELIHMIDCRINIETQSSRKKNLGTYKQKLLQPENQLTEVLEFIKKILHEWDFYWGSDSSLETLDDTITEAKKHNDTQLATALDKLEKELTKDSHLFRRQTIRRYQHRILAHTHKIPAPELLKMIGKCLEMIADDIHGTDWCIKQIDETLKQLEVNHYDELLYQIEYQLKAYATNTQKLEASLKLKQLIVNNKTTFTQFPTLFDFVQEMLSYFTVTNQPIMYYDRINLKIKSLNSTPGGICDLLNQLENELKQYPLVARYQGMRTYQSRILTHKRLRPTDITKLCTLVKKCIDMLSDKCADAWCFQQIDDLIKELKLNLDQTPDERFAELGYFLDDRINQQSTTERKEALQKFKQQIVQHKSFIQQKTELYPFIHICLDQFDYRKETNWCEQTLNQKIKDIKLSLLTEELSNLNKRSGMVQWYHDKIIEFKDKATIDELDKLSSLVRELKNTLNTPTHQEINVKVKELGLASLDTSDCFWTGPEMIPFNQIVAWYKRSKNKGTEFIIRQSPTEELQVIKSTMQLSTEARVALVQELEKKNQPTDKLSLAIQRLIRFVCPCKDTTQITFAYFNTDSGSFPFKFIIDIDQTWLKVEGLPNISVYILPKSEVPDETKTKIDRCISIHHLMRSIRGLKDEYNNKFYDQIVQHLANLSPALTTDGVMSAVDETQKLIDKCLPLHSEERLTQLFTEFFTPPQPPKPTPTLETKESICTREFTCQLFIVITKEANETFESIAQKIITEVGDKGKPHFLLFGDRLWVSVDGMNQPDLNALYEKLFGDQREFIISSRYEHTPHISPCMLRNGKPFEFNVVPIEKDASFFIHGDSASEWDNLYERLIQEVPESQTLMFNTRKRGRVPGHTLYVRTKRMKFSSPHQLLQKIDTNNDFIILDTYTTEMIETIVKTWKHNDTELVKEFNHSQ
jgi:hypothetical protein